MPLQVRFDGEGESALVPAGAGIDAVLGELIGIVHEAMADGTWRRLKACRVGDVRVGVLRPVAQPLGNLVLDGGVRKP